MVSSRWWAPAMLAVALGAGGVVMPAPANAQSTFARVLVDVADVVIRGGVPYYRGGNYSQYDRLSVQHDHHGRRSYYRTAYPVGHHGQGSAYNNGYSTYNNVYGNNGYRNNGGYYGGTYGSQRGNGYYGNQGAGGYYGNQSNDGYGSVGSGGHYNSRDTRVAQREHARHDRHDCDEHGECED